MDVKDGQEDKALFEEVSAMLNHEKTNVVPGSYWKGLNDLAREHVNEFRTEFY